ncbi:hypothetical protein N499_0465B, partial [Wolbachia pipientis wVitA]
LIIKKLIFKIYLTLEKAWGRTHQTRHYGRKDPLLWYFLCVKIFTKIHSVKH